MLMGYLFGFSRTKDGLACTQKRWIQLIKRFVALTLSMTLCPGADGVSLLELSGETSRSKSICIEHLRDEYWFQ